MKKLLLSVLSLVVLCAGALNAKELVIDKANSSATFKIKHMKLSTVDGHFGDFNGKLVMDGDKIASFSGEAVVKTINTDNEKRDAHLNAHDYFDSVKFPTVEFVSTKVEGNKVHGELTIKGTKKSVIWDAQVAKKSDSTVVTLKGSLNRLDYGVGEKSAMLADELELTLVVAGK